MIYFSKSQSRRTSKMELFCQNCWQQITFNYFRKKIHLRNECSTGFFTRLYTLLPKNISHTFREVSFARKKNGRIKEWIFANVWWNIMEQTIKKVYIISLNKKLITSHLKAKKQRYVLLNNETSYLFERFQLQMQNKLSWNSKSICEFLKLAN